MFNVAVSTVRNLIKNGEISAIKIGQQWRIPAEEIEAFKARNKRSV
jgi:excisionase family DNA binding protein